jgi:glycosyltransferase involved in cell wall biosynthesis
MGHAPNLDAVWWIDRMIEPALRTRGADFDVNVIGSEFPESIYLLERPGLRCHGQVFDLDAVLGSLRVMLAPLRAGAGVKGKVLSSIQAGVPCVMSLIAAEGLRLPPELLPFISDDAEGIADRIMEIHDDKPTFDRVSGAGSQWARETLSFERIQKQLEEALFEYETPQAPKVTPRLAHIPERRPGGVSVTQQILCPNREVALA